MIPDQWGTDASEKDTVVGWNSADFAAAMGGTATYHQAAAGAVGVAIANALSINADPAVLTTTLRGLEVDSFYGKLQWEANGEINKDMYTKQNQDGTLKVFDRTDLQYPLRQSVSLSGPLSWEAKSRAATRQP